MLNYHDEAFRYVWVKSDIPVISWRLTDPKCRFKLKEGGIL